MDFHLFLKSEGNTVRGGRMEEVYFFLYILRSGEVKQSSHYDSLEEAMHNQGIMVRDLNVEEVSPVMKGYI